MRPSFAVEEALLELGSHLKGARLRRRLPQSIVAERAGISLNTLAKIESGQPGVAVGNVAAVLHALGLLDALSTLASPESDGVGQMLETENLPKRIRRKRGSNPNSI